MRLCGPPGVISYDGTVTLDTVTGPVSFIVTDATAVQGVILHGTMLPAGQVAAGDTVTMRISNLVMHPLAGDDDPSVLLGSPSRLVASEISDNGGGSLWNREFQYDTIGNNVMIAQSYTPLCGAFRCPLPRNFPMTVEVTIEVQDGGSSPSYGFAANVDGDRVDWATQANPIMTTTDLRDGMTFALVGNNDYETYRISSFTLDVDVTRAGPPCDSNDPAVTDLRYVAHLRKYLSTTCNTDEDASCSNPVVEAPGLQLWNPAAGSDTDGLGCLA